MKILIWGTGKCSSFAINIVKQLGWNIIAFIDSNVVRQKELYANKKVIAPVDIDNPEYEECAIVLGTVNKEVCECVQKYSKPTITFEELKKMYHGFSRTPEFISNQLSDDNLKNCHLISDRLELLNCIKEDFSDKVTFAEIGVAFGDYSKEILKRCAPHKLYLIDAWMGERYGKGFKHINEKFSEDISSGKVEILRGYSTDKLRELKNKSLDVAYIDTVHDYDTTWQELLLCKDKVKETGYIAGHDYLKFNHLSRLDYGVYDAVNRFAVQYGYEFVYITMEKDGIHSFCLRKI